MDGRDYEYTVSKGNQTPRRDLLRSYGSAVVVVGERTYKKIEDSDGMIGWLARKLTIVALPLFWWIRFQWLSQLSFIDKRIQTVEWVASKVFPQSEVIFSKIDNLARFADSLPDKIDNFINAIGDLVGEPTGLPLFDWGVEVMEEICKNIVSFISDFGSGCAGVSLACERDQNLRSAVDEINEEVKNVE